MKTYCAVYFYKKVTFFKNQFGFGNCFIDVDSPNLYSQNIRSLENQIKEKNKFTGCCIINIFEVTHEADEVNAGDTCE